MTVLDDFLASQANGVPPPIIGPGGVETLPTGVSVADPQAEVAQYYQTYLGRAPDPSGLAYWTQQLQQNPYLNLQTQFAWSPEAVANRAAANTFPTGIAQTSTTPAAASDQNGGLGGLGGLGPLARQMQNILSGWQSTFGQKPGQQYDPTAVGGTFSDVQSPVYRPNNKGPNGNAPTNGYSNGWASNSPFRASF